MFTGLVETIGEVVSVERTAGALRLRVDLKGAAEGVAPGDSVNLVDAVLRVQVRAVKVTESIGIVCISQKAASSLNPDQQPTHIRPGSLSLHNRNVS